MCEQIKKLNPLSGLKINNKKVVDSKKIEDPMVLDYELDLKEMELEEQARLEKPVSKKKPLKVTKDQISKERKLLKDKKNKPTKKKGLDENEVVEEDHEDQTSSQDIKYLYKLYDLWSAGLFTQGVIFFGLTINLAKFFADKTFVNSYKSKAEIEQWSKDFLFAMGNIEFIETLHGSMEVGKKGILHTHCVIGFRAHYNIRDYIQRQVERKLLQYKFFDYKLSFLQGLKDVINSCRYLSKEFTFPAVDESNLNGRKYPFAFMGVYSYFFTDIHDDLFLPFHEKTVECIEPMSFAFWECYRLKNMEPGMFHSIPAISNRLLEEELCEITYFLNFYLHSRGFINYKTNMYRKIEDTTVSYRYVGCLKDFLKTNILEILTSLKEEFKYLQIMDMVFIFNKNYKQIVEHLQLSFCTIKKIMRWDLMEFTDGVYFASEDRFVKRQSPTFAERVYKKNEITIRYYDETFKHCAYGTGRFLWREKLGSNFKGAAYKQFCFHFRNLLFPSIETQKSNIFLCIGVSNSGKTKLVAEIGSGSYGQQNVGTVANDPKFAFENLLDKDLAIIDECEVSPKMLNAFKLFGSGEIMSINAKNKPIVYERLTTKILACANPSENLKDFLADKAIQNRVVLFIFTNTCDISMTEHQDILKEIPRILIACNKIYFSLKKKEMKLKLLSDSETPKLDE